MSKFKNEQVLKINAALVYLSQQNTDAWLKISRNIKKIKPLLVSFQESHQEIVDEYSEKDSKGAVKQDENGQVKFGKNGDAVDKAWEDLNKEEVSIDFIEIPETEIRKEGKPAQLDAITIEPLLDVIIIDG
jgi:hypothetical protein